MKRVYTDVALQPGPDGVAVTLDGRAVRTPAGATLAVPGEALAHAIAREWQAQGETINPATMPMTQFCGTTLDRIRPERHAIETAVLRYIETDMVAHHAEAPPELVTRQHQAWQPLLDWAGEALGIHLNTTTGILPIEQPAEAFTAATDAISPLDDYEFAALAALTDICGSLVVALAVLHGKLDTDAAFQASQLDALWQAEQWGDDAEATAQRDAVKKEIDDAVVFLSLVRAGGD